LKKKANQKLNQIIQPPKLITDPNEVRKFYNEKTKSFATAMSECGKSTIGRFVQSLYKRVVVVDTLGEYKTQEDVRDSVEGSIQFLRRLESVSDKEKFRIIYKLPLGPQHNRREQIEKICEAVYRVGNIHIQFEESSEYCTAQDIDYWLELLSKAGRHNMCSVYHSAQRWSMVHGIIIGNSQVKYCGRLDYHRDFITAREYFPDHLEIIKNLQPFEFLIKHSSGVYQLNTSILMNKN